MLDVKHSILAVQLGEVVVSLKLNAVNIWINPFVYQPSQFWMILVFGTQLQLLMCVEKEIVPMLQKH